MVSCGRSPAYRPKIVISHQVQLRGWWLRRLATTACASSSEATTISGLGCLFTLRSLSPSSVAGHWFDVSSPARTAWSNARLASFTFRPAVSAPSRPPSIRVRRRASMSLSISSSSSESRSEWCLTHNTSCGGSTTPGVVIQRRIAERSGVVQVTSLSVATSTNRVSVTPDVRREFGALVTASAR